MGSNSKGFSEGSQPFQRAVAYQMGRQCPVGREFDLILGLATDFWPGLPRQEAFADLLRGLSERQQDFLGGREASE